MVECLGIRLTGASTDRLALYLGYHYIRRVSITEPAFFVLTALVGEPRHGYGIVGEVETLSGGRVQLKIGSLYGVLDRLVGEALVELDREEAYQGRLRRYYRITSGGLDVVRAETARMAANARAADRRLKSLQPRLES
jgi:DNA-binding PadR family transcriptional regulator